MPTPKAENHYSLTNEQKWAIKAKDELFAAKQATFEADMIAVQNNLMGRIKHLVQGIKTSPAGKILESDQANLAFAQSSLAALQTSLKQAKYQDAIAGYINGFDETVWEQAKNMADAFGTEITPAAVDTQELKRMKAGFMQEFDQIGEQAVMEVFRGISASIFGGAPISHLEKVLRETITGTDVKGGSLKRYTKTYARSYLMGYDRKIGQMQADAAGYTRFLYLGPEDSETRSWCSSHIRKVYTKKQIEEMNNGQGIPVKTYGGGWNCRHFWYGVPDDFEQKAEKEPQKAAPPAPPKDQVAIKNVHGMIAQIPTDTIKNPAGYQALLQATQNAMKKAGDHFTAGDIDEQQFKALLGHVEKPLNNWREYLKGQKAADLKTIAKNAKLHHWQWAPKSEMITLLSQQPGSEKVTMALETVEQKWMAWKGVTKATKQAKKAAVKPPTPEKGQVEPQPVKTPPAATSKAVTPKLEYQGKAHVGGAHAKHFYMDKETGDQYLFKPNDLHVAEAEASASKIARMIDPSSVEVNTAKLTLQGKKQTGSLQRMVPANQIREDGINQDSLGKLSKEQIRQIQREHVVDWLTGNHDGHGKQFLVLKDGNIKGLDKGQAWKYSQKEKLAWDYHPNSQYGEQEPIYNRLLKDYIAGNIDLDFDHIETAIRRVEGISDAEYTAAIKPYADARFGKGSNEAQAFTKQQLDKKHTIRADFEELISQAQSKKTGKAVRFRFSDPPKEVAAAATAVEAEDLDGTDSLFAQREIQKAAKKAGANGGQGYELDFDGDQVEDQAALFYTRKTPIGEIQIVAEMKVLPHAQDAIVSRLDQGGVKAGGSKKGDVLAEDEYWPTIQGYAKTVGYHKNDGAFNSGKVKAAKEVQKKIAAALKKKNLDPEQETMLKAYMSALDAIDLAAEFGDTPDNVLYLAMEDDEIAPGISYPEHLKKIAGEGGRLKQYTRQADEQTKSKKRTKSKLSYQVEGETDWDLSRKSDGTIVMKGKNSSFGTGQQVVIDLGDGYEAIWKPSVEGTVPKGSSPGRWAWQRTLEITGPVTDKAPTQAQIKKMMAKIQKLGIDTRVPTAKDREIVYLSRQAYLTNDDATPQWRKILETKDQATKIKKMQAYLSTKYGHDITKHPDYNPDGQREMEYARGKYSQKAGRKHYKRLDIRKEDVEDLALYHSTRFGGYTESQALRNILLGNGIFSTTAEKIRNGIADMGGSAGSDMHTGGATYAFTRITFKDEAKRRYYHKYGLILNNDLLMRQDAISYNSDKYGDTGGRRGKDVVRKQRLRTVSDYKNAARLDGNETNLKHGCNLLEYLEEVLVPDQDERKRVLQVFKEAGIKKLPNGRTPAQIVRVK